jgi:hypothetical protein
MQSLKYIPVIHSGKALLEKFDRLEEAKMRFSELRDEEGEDLTVEEVLHQKGFVSDRLVDSMVRDIIKPAKRIGFIDIKSDAVLAAKLVDLYSSIREQRNDANLSSGLRIRLGGPLEILNRYVEWLIEKDWEASSRVLKLDSPAFSQFRRDFRSLEGSDPITGMERHND